jgi:thioredoxin reductase (NADPH)
MDRGLLQIRVLRKEVVNSSSAQITSVSNTRRGLPLKSSMLEQIFPTLTPAQISRIAPHGHVRPMQRGEVIVEQGDRNVPFFVVVSGEVEIVRPSGDVEMLLTAQGSVHW